MAGDDEAEVGLDAAYALETPEDNRKLYARWATTYESKFVESSGYVYPRQVAEIFAERVTASEAPVLDVGCGTGMVGEHLRHLGIATVDGIDISPEMLAEAEAKTIDGEPIYRRLIEADLTEPLTIPSRSYGGIVSAGTFTHGHLGPDALGPIIALGQPGAPCAIGINAAHFAKRGFDRKLDRYRDDELIGPYEVVDAAIYVDAIDGNLDQLSRVVLFTVGAASEVP